MPWLSVRGPNNLEVNQRTRLTPAGLNPSTCSGRTGLHLGPASECCSHSNSGLSAEWLLTWKNQSAVLLAAGTEETKEHNHTNHNHPAPLPPSTVSSIENEGKKTEKENKHARQKLRPQQSTPFLEELQLPRPKYYKLTNACYQPAAMLALLVISHENLIKFKHKLLFKPQLDIWVCLAVFFFFLTPGDFVLSKSSNNTPVDK